MQHFFYIFACSLLATAAIHISGCDGQPSRVESPHYDPAAISVAAMTQFDTNGDGAIAGDELAGVASFVGQSQLPAKLIDANGDGRVTADEIRARVRSWIDSNVGLMSLVCSVTLNGRPLEGATVRLVPEDFMKGSVQEAVGTTGPAGTAVVSIDRSKLPPDQSTLTGIRSGYYRVEITHPSQNMPARYNTNTILGEEFSNDGISLSVTYAMESP